jgi:copper chaperone NosL
MIRFALVLAAALALGGCKEEQAGVPQPAEFSQEALGYYCQMYIADHPGPKAQIFLSGSDQPLWFSQVSDARAFVFDPERVGDIVAIYVNDVGKAESWGIMGEGNWIAAETAYYVIGSPRLGGMGTPEALPFGSRAAAEAADLGGQVVTWAEIPETYVRPDMSMQPGAMTMQDGDNS